MRLTGYVQKIEAQRTNHDNPQSAQTERVTIKIYQSNVPMYDSFTVPNLCGLKLNDEVAIDVTVAGKAKAA